MASGSGNPAYIPLSVIDRTEPFKNHSVKGSPRHDSCLRPLFCPWISHFPFLCLYFLLRPSSYLFPSLQLSSIIDQTDLLRIRSVNGSHKHDSCFCSLVCHWSNGSLQDSFFNSSWRQDSCLRPHLCQWISVIIHFSFIVPFPDSLLFSSLLFSVIFFLCHWLNESNYESFGEWQLDARHDALLMPLSLSLTLIEQIILGFFQWMAVGGTT